MSNEVQVVQDKRVKIPLNKLIELRSKDVTIEDMAKQFDCTERAIYKRLAQFHTNPIDIKSFADNKEKTLLFMQAELVNSFTKAQINKIPPYHRIVAFGILEDKLKQMSAGSTGNINILNQIVINLDKTVRSELKSKGIQDVVITPPHNEPKKLSD